MKKTIGSALVALSLSVVALAGVSLTGCSSNTGVVPDAPGAEEPEEELSEEEVAAENAIGLEEE